MPDTRVETRNSVPEEMPAGRVAAARELLRLERRIARAEQALALLLAHRARLLTLIGGA